MALIKEIELENGMICDYWRIVSVTVDHLNSKIDIGVHLYKSKIARNNGKEPVKFDRYGFHSDSIPGIFTEAKDLYKKCYDLLKVNDLSGSVDD